MTYRQPEVPEALDERLGDRPVVLDEQDSYTHAFPSLLCTEFTCSVDPSRYKNGQEYASDLPDNVSSGSTPDENCPILVGGLVFL